MEIQTCIEKILKKHNVDAFKDFYLKLKMPPHLDLVMERDGKIVRVGHYREENGDLFSDPGLVMYVSTGEWHPMRLEQMSSDDIICTFDKKRKGKDLGIYPDKVKEFIDFQRLFAKNIDEQDWNENGSMVGRRGITKLIDQNPIDGMESYTEEECRDAQLQEQIWKSAREALESALRQLIEYGGDPGTKEYYVNQVKNGKMTQEEADADFEKYSKIERRTGSIMDTLSVISDKLETTEPQKIVITDDDVKKYINRKRIAGGKRAWETRQKRKQEKLERNPAEDMF